MSLFAMAWRNVWRNRRRSLVTMAAISFALLVMILYAGLMEGYLRSMEQNILDLEVGDVQIFAGDYRENPSLYTRIEDDERVLASLDAAGLPASGRVLAFGLAAVDESAAGISLRGVDLERDAAVTKVHEEVETGSWLTAADPKGVVIGRRLARTLGAGPGDELVVITNGSDGAMAYDLYRVRGVLRGIADATDRTAVFLAADTLRELVTVPEGVHQIIVRRPEGSLAEPALQDVRAAAGAALDVQSWRQLLPTLSSMLDSARGALVVMHFIIYLAVGILILNAMLMAVFERIRELGVLKALGVAPFDVLRMIVLESGIQTGIAVLVAVALAIPALAYLSTWGIDLGALAGISVMGIAMDPIWRAAVSPATFVTPIATLLVIVAMAVVYPALKAAFIRPVEAMRHH